MIEQGLIDVHSHIVPRELPANPAGSVDKWPCIQCQSATQATVLMGARPFRQIDERSWDVRRRVEQGRLALKDAVLLVYGAK